MIRLRRVQLLVGSIAAAGILMVSAGPAAADHQPDGKIRRKGETSYVGNDIYNFDGIGQTKVAVKKPGKSATFEVKFQNDLAGGLLAVEAAGSTSDGDFEVSYFVNGVETNPSSIFSEELPIGGSTPKIVVKVKVLADTQNGDSFTGFVNVHDYDMGNPNVDDVVRFIVYAD